MVGKTIKKVSINGGTVTTLVSGDGIRQHTKTGRPCGNKSFMEIIERLLERTLTALPRGRPCKEK